MPLTESVRLDVAQAEAAIAGLLRSINDLDGTRRVDVDVNIDETPFRTIDQRLDSIEQGVADVNRETADIAVSANRSSIEFEAMARALGTSEDEARRLADEILSADRAARQIDDSAREVARQLGLADDDARRFANEMSRASRETAQTDRAMGGVASAAGRVRVAILGAVAAFGIRGLVNAAGSAIESFNLLNESVNAVEVTFEAGSDTVFEFGQNVARTAGLARGEFQQAVVPIGALLRNFGFDADQAGDAAVQLTQRAADLASVFNTDVQTAIEAISAGLRGEANPLERFGAGLSAVRVEAKALELGLADTKAEITDLDKVTARYQLILADTARTQGDFARTVDAPANAARVLAAEFENAKASIGESLIPAYQELLRISPELIASIEAIGPAIGAVADAAVGAAPGIVGAFQSALEAADRLTRGLQLESVRDEIQEVIDITEQADGMWADFVDTFTGIVPFADLLLPEEQAFGEVIGAFNEMIASLEAGLAPADALSDALSRVGVEAILTGSTVEIFARRAGLANEELLRFLTAFVGSSRAIGLTAEELQVINNQIAILTHESGGAEAEWNRLQSAMARSEIPSATADIDDGIISLQELQAAAIAAGVSLTEAFGSDLFPAGSVFSIFATAEAEVAAFRDRVNAIGAEIDPLKGATEQLEISRADFVANLQAAFTQEVDFEANLSRLANRGFDALAVALRELGPGASDLVVDFLNNAADASAAENVLDATGNRFATGVANSLREEFRGSIFTGLPADLARELTLAFESDPGTGFDSLAEKQARSIRMGLTTNGVPEMKAAGDELAEEATQSFADRVADLAPDVGYDAALDIARALTTGSAADAATQAGIDWAGLFSAALAANVTFDFQPPGVPTPSPFGRPTGEGSSFDPNRETSGGVSVIVNSPTVLDLPTALTQAEQAAQTIGVLLN